MTNKKVNVFAQRLETGSQEHGKITQAQIESARERRGYKKRKQK